MVQPILHHYHPPPPTTTTKKICFKRLKRRGWYKITYPGVKNKTTRMILTVWLDQIKLNNQHPIRSHLSEQSEMTKFSPRGDGNGLESRVWRGRRGKRHWPGGAVQERLTHILNWFVLTYWTDLCTYVEQMICDYMLNWFVFTCWTDLCAHAELICAHIMMVWFVLTYWTDLCTHRLKWFVFTC